MGTPPQSYVTARTLQHLTAPNPQIPNKQITLHYRPYPHTQAAHLTETEILNTKLVAGQQQNPTTRDLQKIETAHDMALDESEGAGLTKFNLTATVSANNYDELAQITKHLEQLANTTKIQLRKALHTQKETYLNGLPIGAGNG